MASMPVNQLLVGAGNQLVVTLDELGEDAEFAASVRAVAAGEMIEIASEDDIKLPEGEAPLTFTYEAE